MVKVAEDERTVLIEMCHAAGQMFFEFEKRLKAAKGEEPEVLHKKKRKRVVDPNKPKKPTGVFFLFMRDAKERFPPNVPNKVQAKMAGVMWKNLTAGERQWYQNRVDKENIKYKVLVEEYIAGKSNGDFEIPATPAVEESSTSSDEEPVEKIKKSRKSSSGASSSKKSKN